MEEKENILLLAKAAGANIVPAKGGVEIHFNNPNSGASDLRVIVVKLTAAQRSKLGV
jgi:hypothetical protein